MLQLLKYAVMHIDEQCASVPGVCGECVPCRLGTERLVEWATALHGGRQPKAWLSRVSGDVRALSSENLPNTTFAVPVEK